MGENETWKKSACLLLFRENFWLANDLLSGQLRNKKF